MKRKLTPEHRAKIAALKISMEKIELSIRRVAAEAPDSIRYWLLRIADQIRDDEIARSRENQS